MWARIGEAAFTAPDGGESPPVRRSTFKQPQILARVREHRDQAFGLFALAVDQGIREGVLRNASVMLMARSVAALAHGLAMEALDERLPEGEVRPILQIAVDGLTR
jgi:hypothetical protein